MSPIDVIVCEARARCTVVVDAYELDGSRERREIEPYSVRNGKHGPRLMFWCMRRGAMRSLIVSNIIAAAATGRPFRPRYPIEL